MYCSETVVKIFVFRACLISEFRIRESGSVLKTLFPYIATLTVHYEVKYTEY
jgi:hypothetical protein